MSPVPDTASTAACSDHTVWTRRSVLPAPCPPRLSESTANIQTTHTQMDGPHLRHTDHTQCGHIALWCRHHVCLVHLTVTLTHTQRRTSMRHTDGLHTVRRTPWNLFKQSRWQAGQRTPLPGLHGHMNIRSDEWTSRKHNVPASPTRWARHKNAADRQKEMSKCFRRFKISEVS